ncbi:quinoprotein dehydrogenase-associated putative ABC transporter substrate-binding protein [Halomonas sp. WWR20]
MNRLFSLVPIRRSLQTLGLLGFSLVAHVALAAPSPADDALRVCADPSNMPFSNEQREGFENRIAALFGQKLDVPVEYDWLPEQMGFARNTLKRWLPEEQRYACDLILSVGSAFEVGKTTLPYYRSTYVLAYVKGRGLDDIASPADLAALPDARKQALRIGAFTGSPTADWMLEHDLLDQLVSYRAQSGSWDEDPSDMVTQDLVNGDIDIAMIWGPIGGYFANAVDDVQIEVVPFPRDAGGSFDFPVSMGVRYGNDQWLATVQQLINDNQQEIEQILQEYHVPLVPLQPEDLQPQEDDDD